MILCTDYRLGRIQGSKDPLTLGFITLHQINREYLLHNVRRIEWIAYFDLYFVTQHLESNGTLQHIDLHTGRCHKWSA
ncbi:hypothetical protein RchiOBHm_Chr7g0233041 [Rosa chinensis]|uniref:Uncharacterized protein n=1 Tax=Rosa chinensis TaxID=74649 RepID=A0A2P6PG67_ROSCH|nr:hypothetical protein RchiOBHm_Chr7g0233041 [Rosa chinensis]